MKKIALEEHFTRPELAGYTVAPGSSIDPSFMVPFEEKLLEFDRMRLAAMDEAGIDLAVLSVTSPGVQAEPDTSRAIKLAREANDFLSSVVRKHPTRYAGFAHLPMQDVKVATDELVRCVKQLGFKGALINGHTNGHYLDEEMYLPFWERVQELGVPIYLHPRDPHDLPYAYHGHPELLGATWSWTVETATHALRLVFGGVFDRFPDVTLILGHMGETLPYLLWRLDARSRIFSTERPDWLPSEVIRKNIVVTTTGNCADASLVCALSALGEDRVLFSVDYPYEECTTAARFIESAPIDQAVRAKVCHRNAERVLRL